MNRWGCECSSELAPAEGGPLLEGNASMHLFSGPRDLAATAAKYMYSFREAEETDVSVKRSRMVHSGSHVSKTPQRFSPSWKLVLVLVPHMCAGDSGRLLEVPVLVQFAPCHPCSNQLLHMPAPSTQPTCSYSVWAKAVLKPSKLLCCPGRGE